MKIAVVGGGIAGLASSHFLARAGHDVTCVEPSDWPGGLVRSERRDGFLCETGPQAVLDGLPALRQLIDDLGLGSRLVRASSAARRRFIYIRGKLRAAPTGPFGLIRGSILSAAGKARLLREPFVPSRAADAPDESVLDFGRRRLGDEAATSLLAPVVIGIHAGDAARLCARLALPRIYDLERRHGSLARGVLRARRETGGVGIGKLASFPDGLEELPRALAAGLGKRLVRGAATSLARAGASWRVTLAESAARTLEVDHVVLAAPASVCAGLLDALAPEAAAALRAIPHAPVAVACLGFRDASADDLGMELGAYGFLVARGERPTILGCQIESTIFPDRAPKGGVLLRVIVGGVFEPALPAADDATIVGKALEDLRTCAGLRRAPDFTAVFRAPGGIPQCDLDQPARLRAIDDAIARLPGLDVIGWALRGVGVAECVTSGAALAERVGRAGHLFPK